ncbi:hypothetical protein BGZ97_013317 [Linnemannia gamsii]|uniref:F-box domain-containing protein n=1 Tax=Linnemannia gamsii TaxID=64522 RepID=A0A9P6R3D8_9FUNG|nr:hypothetical protein BGZ97_013317 [Linnemannia gamsii]
MQPTPVCRPRNPLDLPEIRSQIALFLDRKNCLACMRVSRDWFHDFAPAVWHTVDFAKEATAFGKVTPGILDKYGGFIATALNLTTMGHVQSLQHSKPGIALYTGSKLRHLSASFSQVFLHDEADAAAPCLLIHFPLLESWHLNSLTQPTNRRIDLGHLNFSSGCPLLKTLSFQSEEAEVMSTMLLGSFDRLTSCTLPAKSLIMSTTLGLISHLDSLVTITITGEINEAAQMQWVLLIFKLCRNLQVLSFESLVCDIESVENCWWGCPDLRELRVRFKGLDTPPDIEGCLKQKLRTVWLGTKDYYLPPSSD